MEKDYNLGFESHPTSKDVGFHGDNKKDQIFAEISKIYGIRAVKPEYHIILNVLQEISPTTKQDLFNEINETYGKIFTYNQLYPHLKTLSELGVISNNDTTKEISINPEYMLYPPMLPISSYFVYIFGISGVFLISSFVSGTMIEISISIFLTIIICLLGQHYGSKFNFSR